MAKEPEPDALSRGMEKVAMEAARLRRDVNGIRKLFGLAERQDEPGDHRGEYRYMGKPADAALMCITHVSRTIKDIEDDIRSVKAIVVDINNRAPSRQDWQEFLKRGKP